MSAPTVTEVLIHVTVLHVANLDTSPGSAVGQETTWGRLCRAAGVPTPDKPNVVTVAVVKSRATVIMGRLGGLSGTNARFRVINLTSAT